MQPRITLLRFAILAAIAPTSLAFAADSDPRLAQATELEDTVVLGTAEEELKQAAGVSIITATDIAKQPPTNDLSDIIRKMPGVNLTGNSASGQRGNQRQIDIRGMGPENTLILIDGKPASSRNAVRYGRRGERDSRGDTNWVPAEQVERIEVLRGPAAARYGSGAAGGVVNIITKGPTTEHHGSLNLFANVPEHSEEGATRRANFGLSGPLTETLSYRVYGNLNKTDRDDDSINAGHQPPGETPPAGREGVRNRDINGLLSWQLTPAQRLELEAGFSRQGNIYAGDSQNNNDITSANLSRWLGRETNRLYRDTFAVTHHGDWDFGSSLAYLQYEHTRNNRLIEGTGGSTEGAIAGSEYGSINLKSYTAHGEVNLPLEAWVQQVLTLGAEWTRSELDDPVSTTQGLGFGTIPGYAIGTRSSQSSATLSSLFVEDNLEVRPGTILTPGLRLDHHDEFGNNWSPSLNLSQELTDDLTLKAGIARAFKAPNLYQLNPDYLISSRGNGCPIGRSVSCYLIGNADLRPEVSVNKELGLQFQRDGWAAGITYFRNDYRNKIVASNTVYATTSSGADVLQWTNAERAVVEGLEGNLTIPLAERLTWTSNLTWMLQSKDKETGDPLSLIPRYTLNSMLDWHVTDQLSTQLSLTSYGRQQPPSRPALRLEATNGVNDDELGSYSLVGLNLGYQVNANLRLGAGIDNLLDKRLFREGNASDAGAATYNEPGRTFYTSLSASF